MNPSSKSWLKGRKRVGWHVGVCYGALEGEEGGGFVHSLGELSRGFGRLEAEMVVAVAELCFAARMDYVDLCGELVGWSEVGFADEGEPGVGVVRYEGGRVG